MSLSDVEFEQMLADIDEPEKDRGSVVAEVSQRLGVPSQWLDNVINFESRGGDPQAANPKSSAKGLIQFTDATARRLGYGSSHELITKNPTVESQMWNAVYPYLSQFKPETEADFYLSVFYPTAMGGRYNWEFPADVQRSNPGIRTPQDYIDRVKGVAGAKEYVPPTISDDVFEKMMTDIKEPEKQEAEKIVEKEPARPDLVRTEKGYRRGASLEEVAAKELPKPSLEEKIIGGAIDWATRLGQKKEETPAGTTAVAPAEPVSPEKIITPGTEQSAAEEIFAGTGAEEIKEKPEATIEGTLARMFANVVSIPSHIPGFFTDIGQSISEKVAPAIQQLMGGIDNETREHVEAFNGINFKETQDIKNKYADQYKAAGDDEKIKDLQRRIIREVHSNRMTKAREYAKDRGLDEEKFLTAVRRMPAGKQYALELADIAYNNAGTRIAKHLLEKYPSPQEVFGGGVLETFKKSPIKGLQYMGLAGLENMGNYALFAINAPAGLTAIGLGTAGQRAKELRDKDIADGKRLLAAAGYGVAEAVPEMFGSAAIMGRLKDAFKTTVKEIGKEAAEKGMKELLAGMFRTGMKEWGVEFAEENVTSLSQIMIDVVSGADASNAKDRLKNYLTSELPELAAATWPGGAVGAARVSMPAHIESIKKSIPTEKPTRFVKTREGVEVREGFEEALSSEITKSIRERTPEEIQQQQDIAKAQAGELKVLPATGGEIEVSPTKAMKFDFITGKEYPVEVLEKAREVALQKIGGEIKENNEAQYDEYLKQELDKYKPPEAEKPSEAEEITEISEEENLPTPEQIETKQPSPEPQFNIEEMYKDEFPEAETTKFKPERPSPKLAEVAGSTDLLTPSKIRGENLKKVKSFIKEQIISGGNLPKAAFEADIERKGWYSSKLLEIEDIVDRFDKTTDNVIGKRDLTDEESQILNGILAGEATAEKLPVDLRNSIKEMRDFIDDLSTKLQETGATSEDLNVIIEKNKGIYLTRSFRKWTEPNWAKKVPQEVKNRAQAYLKNEIEKNNEEILDQIGSLEIKKRQTILPVTAVEQKMMEKGIEIEDSISKAREKTDKEINKIKKNIEDNKKKLLSKAQFLNKRKTAIWRGRKVKTVDQEYKSLKKQEKDIENKLAKTQEMDEINDDIVSVFDEMQGKLAEVQEKISLSPTRLPDIGDVITFFNNKIKKIDFAIKKLDKVEQEQIQKVRDIIEKDLIKTLNNINEERTAAWRSPDKDVEFQTKSIDDRIAELKDRIYEVDDETTHALVESILYTDENIGKIITEGIPLGRKRVDILKKRKNLSEEMRALLGEIKDVRANFVNTSMKIADLISRQNFLNKVEQAGKGSFLFEKPRGEYIARLGAKESKTYDPLAKYYTTPEIKKALYETSRSDYPEWLKWWMKGIAVTKYSKTILYPQTHSKNLFSNTGFAAMNGLWKIIPEIKNISSEIIKDKKAFFKLKKELTKIGVVGESVSANELYKVFEEAQIVGADYLLGKRWQRKIKKAINTPAKLYAFEDDIWKILAYKAEYSDLKKIYPEKSEQDIQKQTAEIIRLTWPTWSMTPKVIQDMRRFPVVGTFLSFQYQTMRTSINTLRLAVKELKDTKTKSMGMRRLTGTMAYATLLGSAAMASRMVHGITSEEDKKLRKRVAPPWDRDGLLMYTGKYRNKYSYLNASHYIPHQFAADAAIAVLKGETWQDKFLGAAGEVFEPYISPDIFTEKMLELRDNEKKTGGKVYLENDEPEKIALDVTMHFADALEPGFITSGRRVAKAVKGEETFWKKYTLKEELPAAITGFRGRTVNLKSSFLSHLFKYRYDKSNLSRDRKKYGLERSKELELDLYYEFSKTINDFKYLGLSRAEINSSLKEYGISDKEIDALVRKTYNKRINEKYRKLKMKGGK